MLPFVHGKHVHATAVKVKDAAQAEAKAAGAKLRTLRDDEKGSSKAKNLTRITNLCAEYPGVHLEQLVAEALATPLPKPAAKKKARKVPPTAARRRTATTTARPPASPSAWRRRRSGWSAARYGCRSARRCRRGCGPPPYTKAMVAMLRVVPPRQPSAEVNAERALFASRRHFEVGEAAIEFGVALRCAFIAGAEGTERPNQKEYAEKWRKVARDEYKQRDAAAAPPCCTPV